jgi:dTDP-glucose pyrophosphorylase
MRIALIPLAGKGQRFVEQGYKDPKPLIVVDGLPMIVSAVKSLPMCDEYIFLCLQEHIEKYHIDRILQKHFLKSRVIAIDRITQGQASTCLLAEKYIDQNAEMIIGACDNGMRYDKRQFEKIFSQPRTDAVIFTFRNNPTVLQHPEYWGWVEVGKDNVVRKISVKKSLSISPMLDHAIVGAFAFRKAEYFFKHAKKMIEENSRVNGEFYVDSVINEIVANGLSVKFFEIGKYIGWGTPADLKTYEYWSHFFELKHEK